MRAFAGSRGTSDAIALARLPEELSMPEPTKQYRARIWVKLTDEFLPTPLLTKAELQARLVAALEVGDPDSPIASLAVDDPQR